MDLPDAECVRLCLDGHPEIFRTLLLRYEGRLLKYLVARIGNHDAAAEVAQETMVRAYFTMRTLKKPESFYAWLLGIADRVTLETRRAQIRSARVEIAAVTDGDQAVADDVESNSLDEALGNAVRDLPDAYRQVILLRFYGDQSCADISRSLGVPLGTVTSRLSRAYCFLREALANRGDA